MLSQEIHVGRDCVGGKREGIACIGAKGVGNDLQWQRVFEPGRELEPEFVVERDEAGVESGVVEAR